MKKMLMAGAVFMAAFCESTAAEPKAEKAVWSDNYIQIRKTAAEKKLPILMLFSGSDWCPPCIRLDKTVLDTPAFAAYAAKGKFLLFKADFPRNKKIAPETAAQNRQLMQTYGVRGVPTVILTDASGKEFARTGFRPGGVKKYIAHLETLLKKAPK